MARTIQLPPDKASAILAQLQALRRSKKPVQLTDIQKLHGKLQFTTVALPCGKALLGPLDSLISAAAKHQCRTVKIKPHVQDLLSDWTALIQLLTTRPTHVNELVEREPSYRGFVDASKWGVGGVWFGGTSWLEPIVWFFQWPSNISDSLCSSANPTGPITISDLELAGIVLQFLVLEAAMHRHKRKLQHQTVAIWCDNMPAVAWTYKFRASTSRIASRLLRAFAVRLHTTKSALTNVNHISGVYNTMADVASRKHTTNPSDFLTKFSTTFPPPQDAFWTLYQFSNKRTSKICSELRLTPSPLASWRRLTENDGVFGRLGPNGSLTIFPRSAHTSQTPPSQTKSLCWLPSPTLCDPAAFHAAHDMFAPKQSKWRYAPSARSSYWTDNKTRWDQRKAAILKRSNNFWKATDGTTPRPNRSLQSHSPFHATSTHWDKHQATQKPKP